MNDESPHCGSCRKWITMLCPKEKSGMKPMAYHTVCDEYKSRYKQYEEQENEVKP